MRRLLALALVAALSMIAVPATASDTYAPCTNTGGADGVITLAAPFSGSVDQSPVQLGFETADAGTYVIDLQGLPQGSKRSADFFLSWDGAAAEFSDYDLYVDGFSNYDVGVTESQTVVASHCQTFTVGVDTFIGTPLDTVTLAISI